MHGQEEHDGDAMGDDGLPPGHVVGQYRIERELDRGGFGITYLARQLNTGRRVAIKEHYPRDWASRADNWDVVPRAGKEEDFAWGLSRFCNEAQILRELRHDHIVRVYEDLPQHDTRYIVLEFIEGEPLAKRLKAQETLRQADIEQFVLRIMDGLSEVHDKGVFHRDVTPSNIMLAEGDRGVLIDFGSARPRKRAESGEATTIYTPGYTPIEQLRGEPESAATDIYALGAVLYRCVVGKTPCDPREREHVDHMPRASDVQQRHEYRRSLLQMIDAALNVKPEDRPQSIADWKKPLSGSDEPEVRSASYRATDGSGRSDHELADEGDADAQLRLGMLYAEGDEDGGGCDQDRSAARLTSYLGVDPDLFILGGRYAFAEMKLGAVKFADFAKTALDALGERARPYLRDWYETARDIDPPWLGEMSGQAEIDAWYGTGEGSVQDTVHDAALKAPLEKSRRMEAGLDPKLIALGARIAGFHVEAGARKFAAYVDAMRRDLGDEFGKFKDYLRSWYEAVRHFPGVRFADDMSTPEEIDAWYATGEGSVQDTVSGPAGEERSGEAPGASPAPGGGAREGAAGGGRDGGGGVPGTDEAPADHR